MQISTAASIAIALFVPTNSVADTPLRISGVVKSSYEIRDRIGPEAQAELRIRTKRIQQTRATLKLEGRYFRDSLVVEDAYVDHKANKHLRFQLGVNKKKLGLEYEQSQRDRLTPTRSAFYQKLEQLGIVGRQMNLRARTKPTKHSRLDVTVGTDGSRNANLLVYVARERSNLGYGFWGLMERHRVNKGYLFIWAHAASLWYISDQYRGIVELLGGIDSFETELRRTLGADRRVYFLGPKFELATTIQASKRLKLEPHLQSSVMFHDLRNTRYNTLQILVGMNLYFRAIVVSLNGEYLGESERQSPHARTAQWPNFYVEAKHYF